MIDFNDRRDFVIRAWNSYRGAEELPEERLYWIRELNGLPLGVSRRQVQRLLEARRTLSLEMGERGYATVLQLERLEAEGAVRDAVFYGTAKPGAVERFEAVVFRLLLLEEMPVVLRAVCALEPRDWHSSLLAEAQEVAVLWTPERFNITEIGMPGIAMNRAGLMRNIELAMTPQLPRQEVNF